MLSYRLGTVNDFHWEFKPVLSYSKPHTFSTFFYFFNRSPILQYVNGSHLLTLEKELQNSMTNNAKK